MHILHMYIGFVNIYKNYCKFSIIYVEYDYIRIEVIVITRKNSLFKLEMLILRTLLQKDCYGYEITQFIKNQTNNVFEIKEGVMYPLLHNLLENNYISSFEEIVNRRIRVYYHIEESGKLYLNELRKDFEYKVVLIQNFLNEDIQQKREGTEDEK